MLAPLVSAIAPFVLWPLEYILPYPYIIEELAKAAIIILIIKSEGTNPYQSAFLAGLFFGITESVLYLFNILPLGSFYVQFLRLATTIPFHIITFFLILIPTLTDKKLMPIGLALAIITHYFFNLIVGTLS